MGAAGAAVAAAGSAPGCRQLRSHVDLPPASSAPSALAGKPIDPTAPLQVDLLGGNRERLRARLPTLGSADLGVQFKA